MIKSLPWIRTEREQITDLHISNNEKLQEIRDLRAEQRKLKAIIANLKRKARRA